ncbi:MAG: DUF6273 domain-containing protein [Eubacteriales bacterium]|nr:DUF6273 domain-containing protein [Eubacteriales bacterium]
MAVLKCKMCGGDLEILEGQSVCECEYCGSKQTVASVDDEKKTNLFNRANRLRMNAEFDKASAVYENLVAEFPEEAEAYWGLCLCAYGIEYVDDPASGEKKPTCHRTLSSSIMEDPNFEQACDYGDMIARRVYRDEAKEIDRIQRGILSIAGTEDPYDVFICYKETAEGGGRTEDSVLAQEVYDELIAKGYKVFFSRITLEDKLGVQYEPYIFAALSSAKVMLAFGTSFEYYDAVWVKNEWSRFLSMMKTDKKKTLIPCFKDLDAYDMPKEFKGLQAQDMGKIGWKQDLVRGVEKLLGGGKEKQAVQQTIIQQVSGGPQAEALIKRGYMSLEDCAFDEAKTFFNDALNSNAESADAYLGLFMADIKAKSKSEAKTRFVQGDYTGNRYWQRTLQFASGALAEELASWTQGRDVRLKREAEEQKRERKANEEAKRKRQAEAAAAQAQLAVWKAQLDSGNFAMTAEQQAEYDRLKEEAAGLRREAEAAKAACAAMPEQAEKKRLEEQISAKKSYLADLGFFKGKEKKQTQEEIDVLERQLSEVSEKIRQAQAEADRKERAAQQSERTAEDYIEQAVGSERDKIRQLYYKQMYGGEVEKGKIVTFGRYQQTEDGKDQTPIKWQVLERTDKKALLISQYGLARAKYNEWTRDVTWESCTLRKWLNADFADTAFMPAEKAVIAETLVSADKNPRYDTAPGRDTKDRIFLLSIPEAEKYFASNEKRSCAPTAYAKKAGASGGSTCWWWLRSPGSNSSLAASVSNHGSVYYNGYNVNRDYVCIRPALWINLES